jgi:hypothetical protein
LQLIDAASVMPGRLFHALKHVIFNKKAPTLVRRGESWEVRPLGLHRWNDRIRNDWQARLCSSCKQARHAPIMTPPPNAKTPLVRASGAGS